jgi:hypothetical protein
MLRVIPKLRNVPLRMHIPSFTFSNMLPMVQLSCVSLIESHAIISTNQDVTGPQYHAPSPLNHNHNFTPPSALLAPSLNTYPFATGLTQLPPPVLMPTGAFFNRSVKKTGCRLAASKSTCLACSGLVGNGLGGMASIWVLGAGGVYIGVGFDGVDEWERVGCWFRDGGMD